jgi:hypothetical protein
VERHRAIPDARHSASPGCDRPGCSPVAVTAAGRAPRLRRARLQAVLPSGWRDRPWPDLSRRHGAHGVGQPCRARGGACPACAPCPCDGACRVPCERGSWHRPRFAREPPAHGLPVHELSVHARPAEAFPARRQRTQCGRLWRWKTSHRSRQSQARPPWACAACSFRRIAAPAPWPAEWIPP